MENMENLLSGQKKFYLTQATKNIQFRLSQLKKLHSVIKSAEPEILSALQQDFRKSSFEGYGTEVGLVLSEISYMIRNLKKWIAPRRAGGNLLDFISTAKIYPQPFGQVLVIAPWNYPFQLIMTPLAGAMAAGNTVVVKPSEITRATSSLINKLISENFPPEYVCCIQGGKEEAKVLLRLKFDFIFFTGSEKTGREVLSAAAKNLIPVCLELGGKSPCIVDKTASIDLTCRRIVWGKFLNAGQSCVAPDYILVHRDIAAEVKEGLKKYIIRFYGENPQKSTDFPRIINKVHFKRIQNLIDREKIFYGGHAEEEDLYIAPTILENVSVEDLSMQEEIFGPVLPVIEYSGEDEITTIVNRGQKPLSFYLFSRDRKLWKKIILEIEAGNGNLNDTVMQFANKNLPFGGRGSSGMGSYHGKYSVECFSHMKAVNRKFLLVDLSLRYPPYNIAKLRIIRWFLN